MARYFSLCLWFVGLATLVASHSNPTIYIQKNENVYMGTAEKKQQDVTKCYLNLPNGTAITLNPGARDGRYHTSSYQKCITGIYRVNERDSGTYTITTAVKNKLKFDVASYDVEVREKFEKKSAVPSDSFSVYPDQLISVRFSENFTNLKSCKLLDPSKKEIDLGLHNSVNIKKLGHCGLKMTAKKEYDGEWTLIADLNNNTAYYMTLTVHLRNANELHPAPLKLSFKHGDAASVSLRLDYLIPKMCYLVDPHGYEYPVQTGNCNYEIGLATDYHAGVWKAHYAFEGMETLVNQEIAVEVYNDIPLNSSVIHTSNGDVNLLCQVRGRTLNYCNFVRPDGEILHMTYGVGNQKYEYYGNGAHSREVYLLRFRSVIDCGITIRKPRNQDYGSWRCLVKVDGQEIVGTVLKVTSQSGNQDRTQVVTKADDVYVKRGEPYKIKCTAEEALSYCWLRSPNGTVYSVLGTKSENSHKVKPGVLRYDGIGLELGDCMAQVSDADDNQAGKWTCHMGIKNGPEVSTSLNVIVTETHLMAERETVLLGNAQTDLICRPLLRSNKAIEACRWVNPLGHGINVEREGRYLTETGTTQCKLTILVTNLSKEHVGRWSCYARFAESQEEEDFAHINVVYQNGIVTSSIITIAICTIAFITISVGVFVVYKRRLAVMREDEKIILEKPAKFP